MKKDEIKFELKTLIGSDLLKRDGNKFILNIQKLSEENLDLAEYFTEKTEEFINLTSAMLKEQFGDKFNLLIEGLKSEDNISEIRVNDIGKIICLKGMVSKATKPLILVESRTWECGSCGTILKTPGIMPEKCSCGRRGKFMEVDTKVLDLQEIEVEELQDNLQGKQPHKIRVRLMEHLTDKSLSGIIQPGNKIKLTGIIQKIKVKTNTEEELLEFRVFALGIENLEDNYEDGILEEEDIAQIYEIAALNPLEKLKDALAPSIFGYDDIKRALVLQQVFGVKRVQENGKTRRDKSHILIVGDAGLAKSTLAINVKMRSPKSYYVTGEGASNVGLTATVERDQLTNTWQLKAGILPRANNGVAIIDEIDKAGEKERNSLHTPMELGFVQISKAGIDARLNSDCSILAIANPKNSVFETEGKKSLVEQIDLSPTLLNRFDLIFVVRDKSDEKRDREVGKMVFSGSDFTDIPVKLFRKYINYARILKPELPKELEEEAIKFYIEVRKKSMTGNKLKGMPINARFLEGILRLSEASAKIRLSEKVEKEDLDIAKKLAYGTLLELGLDEHGLLDMARMGPGRTQSMKSKIDIIINLLENISGGELREDELRKILSEKNIGVVDSYNLLDTLSREGLILRQNGRVKLI